ncbi:glycerate kinase [soil metagenome]
MTGAQADGLRVLIAPDCFGDTLTAVEAAQAIAVGWQQSRPGDELTLAPQSDGGPGFVGVLASRLGELRHSLVCGPLDAPGEGSVDAEWVFDPLSDPGRPTAYIECAQACGLTLLGGAPTIETAQAAHTFGVGQLVDAALAAGAVRIAVGLGGSSTSDGGRGMIDALGGLETAKQRLAGVELIVASDVEHPLLGPMGAAHVFGPQKGADPATVELLEQRLTAWSAELDGIAGRPISGEAGAGAAGGLGAALLALGGRRESGAAIIAEYTRLADDVAVAELVITGEGRFDDQSLHGKVVSALSNGAQAHGIPVLVLAGQVTLDTPTLQKAGIMAAFAVAEFAGSVQVAIDDAANQLAGLARKTAAELGNSG